MTAPRPVVITQRAAVSGEPAPQPLDIVGTLPSGSLPAAGAAIGAVKRGVAVANITPDADGTTAGTALNALLASLRTAGVIAP